jgi:hypothetical protein
MQAAILAKLLAEHDMSIAEIQSETCEKETFDGEQQQSSEPQSQPIIQAVPPLLIPVLSIVLVVLVVATAQHVVEPGRAVMGAGGGGALIYLSLWVRLLIRKYEFRSIIPTLMSISIFAFFAGVFFFGALGGLLFR